MANRIYNPDEQYCNENGAPYSGGKLYFYASGTSTPLATYSDQALSVANANPVVLDSAGRTGAIFLQNLSYKVILKDSSLNTIWSQDPVYTSDYSTVTQVQTYYGNPNGNVAGTAGSGVIPSSVVWDSQNSILYICTTTGTASTAVWTSVNSSATTVFSTGDAKLTLKSVADSTWVMMNDGTIGNLGSGASTRANVDTFNLYSLLWTNVSNTYAPVSTGRGASALADFNSLKTIGLTKQLGRALSVSGAGSGLTSRALGETLGEETHVLLTAELAAHNHGVTDAGHIHTSPAHGHGVTDPGHTHTTTSDGTHSHAPQTSSAGAHSHTVTGTVTTTTNIGGGQAFGIPAGAAAFAAGAGATNVYNTAVYGALANVSTFSSGVTDAVLDHFHTLNADGAHTHTANSNTTGVTTNNTAATVSSNTTGLTVNNAGSGTAHNTMQPSAFWNIMIKL